MLSFFKLNFILFLRQSPLLAWNPHVFYAGCPLSFRRSLSVYPGATYFAFPLLRLQVIATLPGFFFFFSLQMLGLELVSLFLHAITLPIKPTPQFPDLGLILTLPPTGMGETPDPLGPQASCLWNGKLGFGRP